MLQGKGRPRERLEDVSVQVWRLLPDTPLGGEGAPTGDSRSLVIQLLSWK